MKLKRLITPCLMLLVSFASAQTDTARGREPLTYPARTNALNYHRLPDPVNAFKINLLSPAMDALTLAWQHLIKPNQSFQFVGTYAYRHSFDRPRGHEEFTQLAALSFDWRFHKSRMLGGRYFGLFTRTKYIDYTRQMIPFNTVTRANNYLTLDVGLLFGEQKLYKRTVVIDWFVGPVVSAAVWRKNPGNWYLDRGIPNGYVSGLGVRAGFMIGLAR